MKITREIKTAILVIASLFLFIWGYSFLKGQNLFSSQTKLYVEYDNVEGLAKSAPVTISGKQVGKVNNIKLNNNGMLLVELVIDNKDFPISKTSEAQIYEPGPIGGKQIAILPNYKDTNLVVSGDKLLAVIKPGMLAAFGSKLEPTQAKIDKLLTDTNALMVNINSVLDAKTKENLKASLDNLNKTLAQFHEASKTVNSLLSDNKEKLNHTLSNIDKVTNDFSKISDSLAKANIGKTVKDLEKTLATVDKIMGDLQSGKGTMGKMLKDDALYNNFSKTSKELELLLQDLRLNPTRYVNVSLFGKKNKPYVSPKDSIKN